MSLCKYIYRGGARKNEICNEPTNNNEWCENHSKGYSLRYYNRYKINNTSSSVCFVDNNNYQIEDSDNLILQIKNLINYLK